MSATHTPGPWVIHPRFRDVIVPAPDAEKGIGGNVDPEIEATKYAKVIQRLTPHSTHPQFHRSRIVSAEEAAANFRLIAAAPELLAACELFTRANRDLVDFLNRKGYASPASVALAAEHARNAIAKAEGRS